MAPERLDTPHGAYNKCKWVAFEFARMVPSVQVLQVTGWRGNPGHAIHAWRKLGRPECWVHYVGLLDEQVVDWTARQFDVGADWPWIYPAWQVPKWWSTSAVVPR